MLRALAERVTRGLQYRRRMPAAFGRVPIWVSPSAGLGYLARDLKAIDPVLLGLASQFVDRGSVVWDVGANLGLFAVASAHLSGPTGRVVAVEPDSMLAALLRQTACIQPPSSSEVVVVQAALAESLALRKFFIARRSRSANHLEGYGSSQAGGTVDEQLLVTITLDWLAERLPLPDVVKVDIEGAEEEVLLGGRTLLERKRPVLICEVASTASKAVTAVLREHGYRIFDGQCAAGDREELQSAPWNTVAIPG